MQTLLLKRRTMMVPPSSGNSISYIRNSSLDAYIDTGITADNTTKVIVWARNFNPNAGALFGSRVAQNDSAFGIATWDGGALEKIRSGYGNVEIDAEDSIVNLCDYHKYELYQGVTKVDDRIVSSTSDSTFSNNYNIHLFGHNNGGSHSNSHCPIDICAVKIYKNGTLVRDFTPTNTPSVGLYDSVTSTLFTNSGSGSLEYGAFKENEYIRLEWIKMTREQYFDSGAIGKDNLDYYAKFNCECLSTDSSVYSFLFGSRTSTNVNAYALGLGVSSSTPSRTIFFNKNTSLNSYGYNTTFNGSICNCYSNGTSHYLYLNSDCITTSTTNSGSFTTEKPILVGGMLYADSSISALFTGRLYHLRFGNERNFVPALKNNEVGLYDTYNNKFYKSQSGVEFIAGPAVIKNEGTYLRYVIGHYVQYDSDNYFTTGINWHKNSTLDATFMPLGSGAYWYSLCGARGANNSTRDGCVAFGNTTTAWSIMYLGNANSNASTSVTQYGNYKDHLVRVHKHTSGSAAANIYFDGTLKGSQNFSGNNAYTKMFAVGGFWDYGANAAKEPFDGRIYEIKVRNIVFKPYKLGNKVGMIREDTGVFYTSEGSVEFTAGPTYELTNYTCDGTAATAINTGLRLFDSTIYPNGWTIYIDFYVTQRTAQGAILRCRSYLSPYDGISIRSVSTSNDNLDLQVNNTTVNLLAAVGERVTATVDYTPSTGVCEIQATNTSTLVTQTSSNNMTGKSLSSLPLLIGGENTDDTSNPSWKSGRFSKCQINSLTLTPK